MSAPVFKEDTGIGDEQVTASSSLLPETQLESPMDSMANDFRTALDEFRHNWQRELKVQSDHTTPTHTSLLGHPSIEMKKESGILGSSNKDSFEVDQQKLAESLYRKAVELEQRGKVYDALPFYRKAVQIVPDIEFKFYERQHMKAATNAESAAVQVAGNYAQMPNVGDELDVDESVDDLYEKFQLDLARDTGGKLITSGRATNVITTERNISDLPPEILMYIMRWVVSAQLDIRSLEQCAAVCKGMYLCARDEGLWRLICIKTWNASVGTLADHPSAPVHDHENTPTDQHLSPTSYTSWRQMFIERQRVLFNGCYISKTKYLRMGENSFQDQYYRPVQLVEYYRYIRFLPDGSVLMMTNADEPAQGVTKLKYSYMQQLRPEILRGHYRLYDDTVTILLQKQQPSRTLSTTYTSARQRRGKEEEVISVKYCIEFRIMSTPKRRCSQLVWLNYSIVQTRKNVETTSQFDLTPSKYPPLWFSPVRSYHLDADAPLS